MPDLTLDARRTGGVLLLALAACVLVVAVALGPARGADHRDGPASTADKPTDITDVYAFISPSNASNLVVAVGVNGLTAPADNLSANFDNTSQIEIHVNGDADLAVDEATVNVSFAGSGAAQTFTVTGLTASPITGPVTPPSTAATAPAPQITDSGGVKVFAGQRDDAFFFDLTCFKKFVAAPYVPTAGLCQSPDVPADTFKGTNVSYVVIEAPVSAITTAAGSTTITAWASTKRAGQEDRMAIPAINTALIADARKDAFNLGTPATDPVDFQPEVQSNDQALRDAVNAVLTPAIGPEDGGPLGPQTAAQVADFVMPDVVTIDSTLPVQFTNGRRLTDDVIDTALKLVLNRSHAAITDAISANDVAFLSTFPYFAAPHQPAAQATGTPTTAPTAGATAPPVQPAAPPASGGPPVDGNDLSWLIVIGAAATVVTAAGGLTYVVRRRPVH
jgi:hypothetical protein